MSAAAVGIVAALPAEARCLPAAGDESAVRVAVCGPGAAGAAAAAGGLLEGGATALVSWGVAGGLDPALAPGALVLATVVSAADGTIWVGDEGWRERLLEVAGATLPVTCGTVFCGDDVLATAEDKRGEFERSGASVTDTESGAVAAAAQAAGVPWIAVRAVVDPVDFEVPHTALVALDDAGRPVPGRILASLLRRPLELPRLLRVARDFAAARRALTALGAAAGPRLAAP